MKWQKLGRIFTVDRIHDWMASHCQCPVVVRHGDRYRVYFSTRDAQNRSRPGFLEVAVAEPTKLLALSSEPVLPLGSPGSFDADGVMLGWALNDDLYYTGWSRATDPFVCGIGRPGHGQILSPLQDGSVWIASPCILKADIWRMWYTACYRREGNTNYCRIHTARSNDGLRWECEGIALEHGDAAGRPCVARRVDGTYEMFYSYRSVHGFRTDKERSYRIGYARSSDGYRWTLAPSGLEPSEAGWDSFMVAYAFPIDDLLFYNGNGFGASGVGVALRLN